MYFLKSNPSLNHPILFPPYMPQWATSHTRIYLRSDCHGICWSSIPLWSWRFPFYALQNGATSLHSWKTEFKGPPFGLEKEASIAFPKSETLLIKRWSIVMYIKVLFFIYSSKLNVNCSMNLKIVSGMILYLLYYISNFSHRIIPHPVPFIPIQNWNCIR